MARLALFAALGMTIATPVAATQPEEIPIAGAPAAVPGAKYCMKVDPLTGSNIERIRCWTREKWADQGVDVDKEWAKEGVRVIG